MSEQQVKYMSIKEFREKGFLQEANRLFFHPLGLALEVLINDDGTENLGKIWDYRNDPEGMIFANKDLQKSKCDHVTNLRYSKLKARRKLKKFNINEEGIQQIV